LSFAGRDVAVVIDRNVIERNEEVASVADGTVIVREECQGLRFARGSWPGKKSD
jgi:hypothetical protein